MRLSAWAGVRERSLPDVLYPVDDSNYLRFVVSDHESLLDAAYLVIDVEVESDVGASLSIGFVPVGESKPRIAAWMLLLPNVPTRVVFPLQALDGQTLFLPRTPLCLKGTVLGSRTLASEVAFVQLSMVRVQTGAKFRFRGPPKLTRTKPRFTQSDQILVDEMGQWTQRKWQGKCHGVASMVKRLRTAQKQAIGVGFGKDRTEFGGSASKRFEATGNFRTHHDGRRWWLVDPAGGAFFSTGPDCVNCDGTTPILPGTARQFAWLPKHRSEYAQAIDKRDGHSMVNFPKANLIRAFGKNWWNAWRDLTVDLFARHGFNTVANWSDLSFAKASGLPYVVPMPELHVSGQYLFRNLPDVFDPAYAKACQTWAHWLEPYRDDPRLLGYFMTNEPHWAFGKHNLASEILEALPGTHTRKAFAEYLNTKYRGSNQSFATAWQAPGKTIGSIVGDIWRNAAERSSAAEQDTWAFSKQIVRQWMSCMSDACRTVLPRHLNLGVRWAWISSDLCYEVGDYCDVFTINNYAPEPPLATLSDITARTNKPVMIGEFHHGSTDRGLPSSGIQAVRNAEARGIAYRRYVELCAAHLSCVGCHYFQYLDQPIMGRFDGENYNIGLLDVCLNPHQEILDAARLTHARLYRVADGKTPCIAKRTKRVPPIYS